LLERRSDASISFMGTARGIETSAVPREGFRLDLVDVLPWSSSLGAKRFLAPASLVRSVAQARSILAREHANVVAGMGGYASMPAVLAARAARIPVVIHEQNAVPGWANLAGARVTRNVALVYEEARTYFPRGARVRVVGNPIRKVIATLDRAARREEARAALGLKPDVPTLVIFGGSLGAARLNAAAIGIARGWDGLADRQMLILTGGGNVETVRSAIPGGSPVKAIEYLDRMELAYAAADLVVSRAGATTLAEIAAVGLPSILVPYPYARRDHQTANARALSRDGGAIVLPDAEATPERVGRMVDSLLTDAARLHQMGECSERAGKPFAAQRLAEWVVTLAEGSR
jgi:UDP-N-acetylglucosamine--N-acetylmuramyl-(pentapeptide) pyrophosphoryl-undecaprenol N-acetylglucosamine transferase